MKSAIISTKTSVKDGQSLTTLAILVDRRKVWADSDLVNYKEGDKEVSFDNSTMVLVKKTNANGAFLKLMPKLSMEISEV
jgi:hypothetical protein